MCVCVHAHARLSLRMDACAGTLLYAHLYAFWWVCVCSGMLSGCELHAGAPARVHTAASSSGHASVPLPVRTSACAQHHLEAIPCNASAYEHVPWPP